MITFDNPDPNSEDELMNDDPNSIDRTQPVTWPSLVARAKSYLAGPDPADSREWAMHFAAGIIAMDKELTRIAGGR